MLKRRYGRAWSAIVVASWVTVINLLLQPVAVLAGTRNWDGDTDTAWGTAGNWDTPPVSDLTTDLANFNNVGPYQAASTPRHPNAGTVSIKGITIGASNGAMTLSGTALSIGASGITIDSDAGALTISSPITLGASQPWKSASGSGVRRGVRRGQP